jgi:hypothetical protein
VLDTKCAYPTAELRDPPMKPSFNGVDGAAGGIIFGS